jgi:predicted transcriptional regulator
MNEIINKITYLSAILNELLSLYEEAASKSLQDEIVLTEQAIYRLENQLKELQQ